MKIILTNCEVSEVSPRLLLLLDSSQESDHPTML